MGSAAIHVLARLARIGCALALALAPLAHARQQAMPDFRGKLPREAVALLGERAKFFDSAGEAHAAAELDGSIVWQLPPAGAALAPDATAHFMVLGSQPMPPIEGLEVRAAIAVLEALGVKLDIVKECGADGTAPQDSDMDLLVRQQCTRPSQTVRPGNHVGVVVGAGPHLVPVEWVYAAVLLVLVLAVGAAYLAWKLASVRDELRILKSPKREERGGR